MKKLIVLLLMLCSLLSVAGCDTISEGSNNKQQPAQVETKKISFVVYRPTADGSEKLLPEKTLWMISKAFIPKMESKMKLPG